MDRDEKAIHDVLDNWHDAAEKADGKRYFDHMAESAVFLGNDAAERWDKDAFRKFAEPRFAAGKGWSYHAESRIVVVAKEGSVAWFDECLSNSSCSQSCSSCARSSFDSGSEPLASTWRRRRQRR